MAGGTKKKKKPAANPARGFATTSVASKVKSEKSVETSNDASENVSSAATNTPATSEDIPAQAVPDATQERELHELSPEELEAQLEQSELQQLVDQQGPKARKEATRQSSRLQTDRRVMRTQAENLAVKEWLPEELMQNIIDLIAQDSTTTSTSESKVEPLRALPEDVALLRVWQLYLVLCELSFPESRVTQALERILSFPPLENSSSPIWGLNEVLEWLALHCEQGELLDYEASKPKAQKPTSSEPDQGKLFCLRSSLCPRLTWVFFV